MNFLIKVTKHELEEMNKFFHTMFVGQTSLIQKYVYVLSCLWILFEIERVTYYSTRYGKINKKTIDNFFKQNPIISRAF